MGFAPTHKPWEGLMLLLTSRMQALCINMPFFPLREMVAAPIFGFKCYSVWLMFQAIRTHRQSPSSNAQYIKWSE